MIHRIFVVSYVASGTLCFGGGALAAMAFGDWPAAQRGGELLVVFVGSILFGYAWGARGKCRLQAIAKDLAAKNRELQVDRTKLLLGFATARRVDGDPPPREASLPRILGRFSEGERP